MEQFQRSISIPHSPHNLGVIHTIANEDPEIREALLRESQPKVNHAIGYSSGMRQFYAATTKAPNPSGDKASKRNHTAKMTDINRFELDAKLELIEARMDARVARIESSVEGFKDEAGKLRSELSHAKYWAIGTAIAVLAIFAGFLQWGLQAQRDENARFNNYLREDIRDSRQVLEQAKSILEEIRAAQAK